MQAGSSSVSQRAVRLRLLTPCPADWARAGSSGLGGDGRVVVLVTGPAGGQLMGGSIYCSIRFDAWADML